MLTIVLTVLKIFTFKRRICYSLLVMEMMVLEWKHSPLWTSCCVSWFSSHQSAPWVEWPTALWGLCTQPAPSSWWSFGGNGKNRRKFSLRPCEILNHFGVDVDVVFVRAYLHYSRKVAASIQHLPPVVYGIFLSPGLHFCHIFQTAVVICYWKVRNLRINFSTPQFEHIFSLCSNIYVNTMIK